MRKITGNEPATGFSYSDDQIGEIGLTIRQQFAAMAMQGLLSVYVSGDSLNHAIHPNEENTIYMASLAVKAADALINELNN